VAILIAITYSRLPWRPFPETNGTEPPPPPSAPATKPDAYAEFP
jgi:alpha-1,6-mannosyltransferase